MVEFLQYIVSGISLGAVYGLVGIGFTMIYNSTKIINFAQGEFVMLSGMIAAVLVEAGMGLLLAIFFAVGGSTLMGWVLKICVSHSKKASTLSLIILTLGFSLTLRGLVEVFLGKEIHRLPSLVGEGTFSFLGAIVTIQGFFVVVVLILVATLLYFFFTRMKEGKAMLGASENADGAQVVGISLSKTLLLNFLLATLSAGIAGIILTPITAVHFESGIFLGLKGFCAAIIGGLANPFAAILGGMALALTESLVAGYISSEYKDVFAFLLLLLILVFRPEGLLKRRL